MVYNTVQRSYKIDGQTVRLLCTGAHNPLVYDLNWFAYVQGIPDAVYAPSDRPAYLLSGEAGLHGVVAVKAMSAKEKVA